MCLYVQMLWCPLRFLHKTMFDSSFLPVVFLGGIMSYLRYLSLFAYSGVEQLLYSVFALFSFVLCTLCCQFLWIVHLSLSFIYWIFFLLLNKIADSFLTNFSNVIKRIFKAKMFQFISIPLQIIKYANGMRI
jgi:hypothetical protein